LRFIGFWRGPVVLFRLRGIEGVTDIAEEFCFGSGGIGWGHPDSFTAFDQYRVTVVRKAGRNDDAVFCRVAFRVNGLPVSRSSDFGFRLARTKN